MKILLLILFLIFSSGLVITSYDAYGHGVGSEIFPPVELNGKLVSVEVTSSTKDDVENDYKGVVTKSKIPLWKKGEQILKLVEKDGYFQILTGGFNDKKLLFYRDKINNGRFLRK